MAEISRDCLGTILDMGLALGNLQEGFKHSDDSFILVELAMAENISTYLLKDCPHPPDVIEDLGPNRQFGKGLRILRDTWKENSLDSNLNQLDDLRAFLGEWLDGMMLQRPSRVAAR
tara:strand:- start:40 stop:390 length:351 start_codon:yes stop_codon:yes gene_type:complete